MMPFVAKRFVPESPQRTAFRSCGAPTIEFVGWFLDKFCSRLGGAHGRQRSALPAADEARRVKL
jgi:hypothetical protein